MKSQKRFLIAVLFYKSNLRKEELIDKLAEYKPLAKAEEREEQNYNMIDNVINNLPQNPEEKKEPAPQKEMRIAAFLAWIPVFLFLYLTPCQNTYIIYFDTESE